uniref:REJ domain-containing protein n=1 Tax=Loa loa TaxID=7209 RepID=A0A1I7VF97_LOALO
MMITTQYNNEDGLCALIKWYHSPYQREPSSDISDDRRAMFGNCHYSITILNETSRETVLFTLDNGNGILLSNLQFSTEYSVAIRSISSAMTVNSLLLHQKNMSTAGDTNGILEQKFLTPACNEVFGSGSLECGSTTATIQLHGRTHCEYSIKLINYDLMDVKLVPK